MVKPARWRELVAWTQQAYQLPQRRARRALLRECLSQHYFATLAEAPVVLRTYRQEYNNQRPHSSLGQQTPAEFRAGLASNVDPGELPKRVPNALGLEQDH